MSDTVYAAGRRAYTEATIVGPLVDIRKLTNIKILEARRITDKEAN